MRHPQGGNRDNPHDTEDAAAPVNVSTSMQQLLYLTVPYPSFTIRPATSHEEGYDGCAPNPRDDESVWLIDCLVEVRCYDPFPSLCLSQRWLSLSSTLPALLSGTGKYAVLGRNHRHRTYFRSIPPRRPPRRPSRAVLVIPRKGPSKVQRPASDVFVCVVERRA